MGVCNSPQGPEAPQHPHLDAQRSWESEGHDFRLWAVQEAGSGQAQLQPPLGRAGH